MKSTITFALGCCTAVMLMATPAYADIIFYTSPGVVQPEENLLFNEPGLIGVGFTVEGITNQTDQVFTITGEESLTSNGGQARVESTDGDGYFSALIDAKDSTTFYTEFESNLMLFAQTAGFVTVTVTNSDGDVEFETFAVGSGQNYFALLAVDFQLIDTVLIESTVAILDLRQIRVGGVQGDNVVPVPEPASLLLLGGGLVALATASRRRKAGRSS